MQIYKKDFTFNIEDVDDLKRKVQVYFQFYGFQISEIKTNQITFIKKSSLFTGWSFNPLNWQSKVLVKYVNNALKLSYFNEGNNQLTPFAFENLFISFFNYLDLYLNTSIDFKEKNKFEIKKAKKKTLSLLLIIIFCILTFSLLLNICFQNLDIPYFSNFGIIIVAYLTLKFINQYWINKVV
jgi:hypothetical protein